MSKENPFAFGTFPKAFTEKENRQYFEILKDGDKSARNKLIEHNLRLVAHIVKRFKSELYETDDLISIGTIGLIKGIDTFDLNYKSKFSSYAARCIVNEILMFLRKNVKCKGEISFEEKVSREDDNDLIYSDVLKDNGQTSEEFVEENEDYEELRESLLTLSEKEQWVIQMRYSEFPKTQEEISEILKISQSYISRIEKRAISKLKEYFVKGSAQFSLEQTQELAQVTLPESRQEKAEKISTKSKLNVKTEIRSPLIFDDGIEFLDLKTKVSVVKKVQEIKELILSNLFDNQYHEYIIEGKTVRVKTYETTGFFAYKKENSNTLNLNQRSKKRLYVYRITVRDENDNLLIQDLIYKDKDTNQIYTLAVKLINDEYDLSLVKNRELVLYDTKLSFSPIRVLVNQQKQTNRLDLSHNKESENRQIELTKFSHPATKETDQKYIVEESLVSPNEVLLPEATVSSQILNYEQQKNQLKKFINELTDPLEKIALFLKLGYVNGRYYTTKEIANILDIENICEVRFILKKGLTNIKKNAESNLQTIAFAKTEIERIRILDSKPTD